MPGSVEPTYHFMVPEKSFDFEKDLCPNSTENRLSDLSKVIIWRDKAFKWIFSCDCVLLVTIFSTIRTTSVKSALRNRLICFRCSSSGMCLKVYTFKYKPGFEQSLAVLCTDHDGYRLLECSTDPLQHVLRARCREIVVLCQNKLWLKLEECFQKPLNQKQRGSISLVMLSWIVLNLFTNIRLHILFWESFEIRPLLRSPSSQVSGYLRIAVSNRGKERYVPQLYVPWSAYVLPVSTWRVDDLLQRLYWIWTEHVHKKELNVCKAQEVYPYWALLGAPWTTGFSLPSSEEQRKHLLAILSMSE